MIMLHITNDCSYVVEWIVYFIADSGRLSVANASSCIATLPITSPEPLSIGHQVCCTPDRSVRLSVCLNTTVRVKSINHGSKCLAVFLFSVLSVVCHTYLWSKILVG